MMGLIKFFISFICEGAHIAQCTCEVRGQLVSVSPLLPPFRFQGWNTGLQTWQQNPLPTKSSHQLDKNFACNSV